MPRATRSTPAACTRASCSCTRAHQPRRGTGRRGDRLAPGGHRRAGAGRCGGAHGGALRAAGQCTAAVSDAKRPTPNASTGMTLSRMPTPPASVLIAGAHVLDPRAGHDEILDVLVRDGEVAELGKDIAPPAGVELVDAAGAHLFPAFVDP